MLIIVGQEEESCTFQFNLTLIFSFPDRGGGLNLHLLPPPLPSPPNKWLLWTAQGFLSMLKITSSSPPSTQHQPQRIAGDIRASLEFIRAKCRLHYQEQTYNTSSLAKVYSRFLNAHLRFCIINLVLLKNPIGYRSRTSNLSSLVLTLACLLDHLWLG